MDDKIPVLLLRYLKFHTVHIIMHSVFIFVFCCLFFLYRITLEPILYAGTFCIIISFFVFLYYFLRYVRSYHYLAQIYKNIELPVDAFPEPQYVLDLSYQKIIKHLYNDNRNQLTKAQVQRNDSIDYYTTWVHQIKTPIAVMRLILQSEDTLEHQELRYELFRIEQYVEMVLCYFRLDANSNDFVFKEYAVDNIIKSVIRKYAGQFIRKKIALQYEGCNDMVLSDEKWLSFIIEQLLSNAIKYTEKGSISIWVKDYKIYIQDTGMGIAPEDLPRIFEKGFTGYNGRADKKSTGLGLYLCKQAANKLSHRLAVESQVGVGTTAMIDVSMQQLEIE